MITRHDLLTLPEAAAELGLSKGAVIHHCRSGTLGSLKISHIRVITREDLEEFKAAHDAGLHRQDHSRQFFQTCVGEPKMTITKDRE